ncbi:hypothetical protein [Shewanella psychrotolerans]|uniref:hypothetical protein n=1 Tax=Shewanella psychrotolerans TaxID=2864206 RepID=UPI001C66033F|nr:hypothetical protein [Shewanella psychrotolerans]QYK01245.1 hypothetical protein K0I62_18100 [Shewanella psychrotolerans]
MPRHFCIVGVQPDRDPAGFKYDFGAKTLVRQEQSDEMKLVALSWALWGSMAYQNQLYKTPPLESEAP